VRALPHYLRLHMRPELDGEFGLTAAQVVVMLPELPIDRVLREENDQLRHQVAALSAQLTLWQREAESRRLYGRHRARERRWRWLRSFFSTADLQRPPDLPSDTADTAPAAATPIDLTPAAMLGGGGEGDSPPPLAPSGGEPPSEPAAVALDVPPSPPVPELDDHSLRSPAPLGAGDGEDPATEPSG
jgi:hypothetical protein